MSFTVSNSSDEDPEAVLVAQFYTAVGREITDMLTESDARRFCRARKWVIPDAATMAKNWAVSRFHLCDIYPF
jgi:hypothetical protein